MERSKIFSIEKYVVTFIMAIVWGVVITYSVQALQHLQQGPAYGKRIVALEEVAV